MNSTRVDSSLPCPDRMHQMFWYVVKAKPHQERVAELNLQLLGVETYCPILREGKEIRGRQRIRVAPLFPGYLFARFHLKNQHRSVLYARGVSTIVTFGSTPATVDDEMITAIKSRLQTRYVTMPNRSFRSGQRVQIQEGPLRGLEAIFERQVVSSNQRAVLLLRALSYQARIVVDLSNVVNA